MQGWETSGLILISGLRTFILTVKFHFYTCSQDHPFVSKVVCVEVLQPSQPSGVMSSAVSYLTTCLLGRLSPKGLTNIVPILLPETDNCPS